MIKSGSSFDVVLRALAQRGSCDGITLTSALPQIKSVTSILAQLRARHLVTRSTERVPGTLTYMWTITGRGRVAVGLPERPRPTWTPDPGSRSEKILVALLDGPRPNAELRARFGHIHPACEQLASRKLIERGPEINRTGGSGRPSYLWTLTAQGRQIAGQARCRQLQATAAKLAQVDVLASAAKLALPGACDGPPAVEELGWADTLALLGHLDGAAAMCTVEATWIDGSWRSQGVPEYWHDSCVIGGSGVVRLSKLADEMYLLDVGGSGEQIFTRRELSRARINREHSELHLVLHGRVVVLRFDQDPDMLAEIFNASGEVRDVRRHINVYYAQWDARSPFAMSRQQWLSCVPQGWALTNSHDWDASTWPPHPASTPSRPLSGPAIELGPASV